ncbi:MAG: adenylate/guanylate cyclase domain-containing protein [Actinomycetota bacterium]
MLEHEGRSGAAIQQKSFDAPDDVRRFPKGIVNLVHVGSVTMGRGILEPGFRWSTSLRPIQGTSSCQIHPLQLMVQGRFHVEMDDGESAEFGPGDVMNVPPGHDVWVVGDEPVVVVDVLGNIGALGVPGEHERLVTTLLMSDIVDSTLTATRLGDAAWKQVLAEHNRLIRAQFDRFRGREVNTTGDGFLATFGSAAGAIRSAVAMRDAVRGLGIELRIGVHTGEVEVLPNDIGGVAVHAASRIMAFGRASEIIVSSVTRGLVEGSDLRFEERGRHKVKGMERPIEVFLLAT